jgi:two-component system OmpR family sensor kinase
VTDPRDAQVLGAITMPDDTGPDDARPRETAPSQDSTPPRASGAAGLASQVRLALDGMPLRARLVTILVTVLVAALILSGWIVVNVLRTLLMHDLDAELQGAARPVARASVNGEFPSRGGGPLPSNYVAYPVWANGDSDTVRRPPINYGLPRSDPDFSDVVKRPPTVGEPFTLRSTAGSTRWRAIALTMTQGDQIVGTVYVATPLSRVDSTIRSLSLSLTAVALLVVGVGAGLGSLAIRRSFQPLVEVEETAATIAAGDLSRRIPERPVTTEVGRLTTSLNGMLAQIESAFRARETSEARTRRFAADASHELRTPLVSIRGFAELYRQGAVPPDEVPRTMRRIEEEAKRMGSLVEDLLLLARLDEQRPGRKDPVDLAVLAGDAVHDARGLDAERQVRLTGLDSSGPTPTIVTGDENQLRQVVANLVANAIRHTLPGTPVEVAVGTTADGAPTHLGRQLAVLEVRDHGQGLTPEQAQRVFERFYRVDSSRRRDRGGGSGLGLSIVSAVVSAHAGTVSLDPTPGGGATFRVCLPVRETSPAEQDTIHSQ